MILLHLGNEPGAPALAAALDIPAATIERHEFPDGEIKLRLPPALPPRVIVYRSLNQPDRKLVELLLAARAARERGARELLLVAPYLAYMRQDTAFAPGEVVSQGIIGRFLADLFDGVITVDPHLHRTATLAAAVPARQAIALSAAPAIGAWIARKSSDPPVLIGPDAESAPWVAAAAAAGDFEHHVCSKTRRGDREVEVVLGDVALAGRHCVIVDDMASTGRTLAACARLLTARGAARVDVAVTHALCVGDALQELARAGVAEVVSTDSIVHPSNRIALAPLLAGALRDQAGLTDSAG